MLTDLALFRFFFLIYSTGLLARILSIRVVTPFPIDNGAFWWSPEPPGLALDHVSTAYLALAFSLYKFMLVFANKIFPCLKSVCYISNLMPCQSLWILILYIIAFQIFKECPIFIFCINQKHYIYIPFSYTNINYKHFRLMPILILNLFYFF